MGEKLGFELQRDCWGKQQLAKRLEEATDTT
jgi:hypothetical protein